MKIVWTMLICLPLVAKEPISLIDNLTVKRNRVEVTVNASFKANYLKSDFFVEYDEDINLEQFGYSINSLPFIMNVISLVWISGEDYSVDEMDIEVYASLKRLNRVFKIMYPKTSWNGRLIPKKFTSHRTNDKTTSGKIALLFSGGIDSTTSSLYHRNTSQLLITAWGQSGLPLEDPELWEHYREQMIYFAHQYGHTNAFLKSNYYYFLDFSKLKHLSPEILSWRMETIEDIGWAGLIAPILLARGIKTLRIASSEHWNFLEPSASNPYIDGNIRFAGLVFQHDLFSMTRCQKVCYIVDLCRRGVIQRPHIIICQKPGSIINCGTCEKCCLTLALLLYADAEPQEYGFDLTSEQAAVALQHYLEQRKTLSSSSLWDYQDLQQKLLICPNKHLTWLNTIDFSQKQILTNVQTPIDWLLFDKMFPFIRPQTN